MAGGEGTRGREGRDEPGKDASSCSPLKRESVVESDHI